MTNDLQAALIPLAKAAGVEILPHGTGFYQGICHMDDWDKHYHDVSIGKSGELSDAEVTVVLGWLAKAGYEVRLPTYENLDISSVLIFAMNPIRVVAEGDRDTLNAALAAAVIALHD